jgi:hypothetical protein
MTNLTVNHIDAECLIEVNDEILTITDMYTGAQDSVVFESMQDAYRFIAEYLTSWDGPTEEFQNCFLTIANNQGE